MELKECQFTDVIQFTDVNLPTDVRDIYDIYI
jgi:hypothetical protein